MPTKLCIIITRKEIQEQFTVKDWDPKCRNSYDSIAQLRDNGLNSLLFTPEATTTKRKWSTNDAEGFENVSKEYGIQPLQFSAPNRILQSHAKELEDDNDSLIFPPNLEESDDYEQNSDRSVDADLKRNLERFIDNDEV